MPSPESTVLAPAELQGQCAIVTGAARGIGFAVALELARRGATVAIFDVIDGGDAVAAIQREVPSARATSTIVDIRDRQAVRAAVDAIVSEFGGLDILVNNAGTCARVALDELGDDLWERDIDTNLRGTFNLTQAAVYPHMRDRGYGRIVNVSSISGIMGGPPTVPGTASLRSGAAYAAAKGGVIALTKWVAKEIGELGITCNSVAPGPIATPMTQDSEYNIGAQAIKRMGAPEDIAMAVAYLASPSAGYVTGDTLKVCGGSAIG